MDSIVCDLESRLLRRAEGAFAHKRVLVTGHTGFKGSWLCTWLSRLGAEVAGLSLAADEAQRGLFNLVSEVADFRMSAYVDIRDRDAVDHCVSSFRPDVIFHLAAQPLVRVSYEEPLETFDVNVRGTAVLLDVVRKHETPVVVCVTTDKCYENTEQIWPYREDDRMGGWDPYSASKGAAELTIASFRRSYFEPGGKVSCASARAGNVVGGGDLSADRLVPDVYRAMVSGSAVVLRHPNAIRPWQHVLESLSGYLTLATAMIESGPDFAEGWNFGPLPSERVSVGQFVTLLAKALGDGAPSIEVHEGGAHEANLLALDVTKAQDRLDWRPILTVDQRVELTAEWLRAQYEGTLSSALIVNQLSWFEEQWLKLET